MRACGVILFLAVVALAGPGTSGGPGGLGALRANLVTLGAATSGDQDIVLRFAESDANHDITWDDGLGMFLTTETIKAANITAATALASLEYITVAAQYYMGVLDTYWYGLYCVDAAYGIKIDPNNSGADTLQLCQTGDGDVLHSEAGGNWFDAYVKIFANALTAGAGVSESVDAYVSHFLWKGTVTHDDFAGDPLTGDIALVTLPAGYRVLSVWLDVTEKFDDGGGAMDACVATVGYEASSPYDNLLASTDVYSAAILVGDDAAEVAYTAVQGGVLPSWSAASTITLELTAAHDSLKDLTTGEATLYLEYAPLK
jgi:hypothetical protein